MADQTARELADLVSHVFPTLPCDAASRSMGDGNLGSRPVTLKRRDGDRYLAVWAFAPPIPGEDVAVFVVRDEAVYSLAARVTGIDRGNSRFLTVTELRRKTQRRGTPRAPLNDLVLISHNGGMDATLIDVSARGVAFHLDRPLTVGATIKAVINFHGSVIPTTAQIRNTGQTSTREYRVGCVFTQISDRYYILDAGISRVYPVPMHLVFGFLSRFSWLPGRSLGAGVFSSPRLISVRSAFSSV
jgi:hypothetical protein